MLFSSPQFIFIFLPLAILGFSLIPLRPNWLRKAWLLVISAFFYAYWKVEYVPLLVLSICLNYGFAEAITRQSRRAAARNILIAGVAFNLSLLGFFKYTNFLLTLLPHLAGHAVPHLNIILPLAISFFTFTQIGYLVDVYRDQSLHYRFLDFGVFVVFFPHLIAGPIVRHWEIIPQFADRDLRPSRGDTCLGLALFLIGLCKKVLLADFVAPYIANVYGAAGGNSASLTWFDSWLGTLAFALQIYFDFSGYSDMAIGLARLFGMKFPINFNSPYQARSITEFWRRWHITLTRFLREYVYFPLGGNRCPRWRHMLNVMITMLLSGLWHGAGWTFVFWGGLHGIFLIIAHCWGLIVKARGWQLERPWYRFASAVATFLAILVTWVFFKASNFSSALKILSTMAGMRGGFGISDEVTNPAKTTGVLLRHLGFHFVSKTFDTDYSSLFIILGVMLAVAIFLPNSQQLLAKYEPALEPIRQPAGLRLNLGLQAGMLLGAGLFMVLRSFFTGAPSPFLYFNF